MADRKQFLTIIDAVALLVCVAYVWSALTYRFPGIPLISKIALLVGYGALIFGLLIGVSAYLNCLARVLRSIALYVASLGVGLVFVQFLILQDIELLHNSRTATMSGFMLVIWFWLRGYRVAAMISSRFPLPEDEVRKMMTYFPPRSFHDLWPLHLFIVFLLVVMPLFVRLYWL